MTQNLQKLFKNLKNVEPSKELEGRILKVIAVKRTREVRRKLVYVQTGLVMSLGALVYTLAIFGKTFLQSDFWNLLKLTFSDTGFVSTHFGDFSFSLLETLPVVEIFAMLVPVFAVMLMLSWYFKFSNNNHYKHIN